MMEFLKKTIHVQKHIFKVYLHKITGISLPIGIECVGDVVSLSQSLRVIS